MKTINPLPNQSASQPLSSLTKAKWKKIFIARTFSRLKTYPAYKQQKKLEINT
jgi:hypothetical protein